MRRVSLFDIRLLSPAFRAALRQLPLEYWFDNRALRERALALFREETCSVTWVSSRCIHGTVQGRTGVYRVTLRYSARQIRGSCSCPSTYHPCKHLGAFLYTLQAALCTGPSATRQPSGRFRPAFQLLSTRPPDQRLFCRYVIAPVLVYQRKDGTDGRFLRHSPTRSRLPGDAETERFIAWAERCPDGVVPAQKALASWSERVHGQTERHRALGVPIELYHGADRSPRTGRPVVVRRIGGVEVRWEVSWMTRSGPMLEPCLVLRAPGDVQPYREILHTRAAPGPGEGVDATSGFVLVSLRESRSLWYACARDLPAFCSSGAAPQDGVVRLARVLSLKGPVQYPLAMRVRQLAREKLGGFVHVDRPPRSARLLTLDFTPVVVVRSLGARAQYPALLEFRFRYGQCEVAWNDPQRGLPVSKAMMQETDDADFGELPVTAIAGAPAVPVGEPKPTAPEPLLVVRNEQSEREEALRLLELLEEDESAPIPGDYRILSESSRSSAGQSGEASGELCTFDCSVWEVLSGHGVKLLQAGFELRLREEPVTRSGTTPGYRVVQSSEDWLELEPGFPEGDGFCRIEEQPAPGLARAGGRIYLHWPDELHGFLARGAFRVGTRELPTLTAVEPHLEDPEHPALNRYRELRRRLAAFDGIKPVSAPSTFVGTLRPYQQAGLAWLWFLHRFELGGILADDMGLGKTVQVLALLALARSHKAMRRALVLCPVSTLANWREECLRFVPGFRVLVHAGPGRARRLSELERADLILVGYDTLRRDVALFRELALDYLVLDEAQAVKNPGGKRRRAVAHIRAPHRLALSGTPVENGVLELWSIIDLVMPGLLGSRARFTARYGAVDAEETAATERLAQTIRPLVLRRTKAEVAPELPPRHEQLLPVELRRAQAGFYESLRRRLAALVEANVASGGLSDSGMIILEAMLRLRQAAILPALLSPEYARIPSAKLELLMDLLTDIGSEGKKALVFSQFTAVLDAVETRLGRGRVPWYRLDGSTPHAERAARIAAFQSHCRSAHFLISLRAGGLGINLTEADYVILLDPWWNPAVEAQAIDRAHRIGRRSPVIAYRIIARGTIEEKLLRLQARKRRLAGSLISSEGGGTALRSLTAEELQELFAP